MAGTDISSSSATNMNDRTYKGNGCPNEWDATKPYKNGSLESCLISTGETYDGETQSRGVLYSFQAATSGSGGSLSTDNAVALDTFCPLGWQMPYGGTSGDYYDKSKSWKYLFETTYSIQPSSYVDGLKVLSYPFSYVMPGSIVWYLDGGPLFFANKVGSYWSMNNYRQYESYRLTIWAHAGLRYEYDNKSIGFPVRCV